MSKHFRSDKNVQFLTVQTVFEGFSSNTAAKAQRQAKKYGLTHPVGHDPGPRNSGSVTMRRYRSGGTPWIVIVDKKGVVRFNGFHIRPSGAVGLINSLKREK